MNDVPLMDPRAQYEPLLDELEAATRDVIRSGRFILGPHVAAWEQTAASVLGVKHCIGVGNGTDALAIALRALGVQPGDEVICPAYTFFATCEMISAVGAIPVFADVDRLTRNLDVRSVRERITGRTRAIVPVHIFGQCADMTALRQLADDHGLALLEDAAQAWGATHHGARAGSMGDAATFSFFPTKNLPCFGDGGMIATNSDEVADLARRLRFHGSRDKQTFELVGYNSRLDELQAAVLQILVKHVDDWNNHRRTVASWYAELGLGDHVELPTTGPGNEHVYHLYVVDTPHRDQLKAACDKAGVAATVYYGNPHHLQPVYADLGWVPGDLPVTEERCATGIALPMFATMTHDQAQRVVEAVAAAGLPTSTEARAASLN